MSLILIGGDILPTEKNMSLFESGDLQTLFHKDVLDLFFHADFRIVNIEGPLTDTQNKIRKSGPHLRASLASINCLKKLNINLAGLANNHILDYGAEGLFSTISTLESVGIDHCGAGPDLETACKPFYFDLEGKRIAVVAVAEREFTIANVAKPGAAPFDDLDTPDFVFQAKENADFLIVLYHGGKEYFRYTAPYVQKRCHKLIEKGADLVLTQHSHCIGFKEEYLNGVILYGQGNLLLNLGSPNEYTGSGMIVTLDTETKNVDFIPVYLYENKICMAEGDIKDGIIKGFEERSEQAKEPGYLEKAYSAFAVESIDTYQKIFLGKIGSFLKKCHFEKLLHKLIKQQNALNMINTLQCDSHRDIFLQGLYEKYYDPENTGK